MTTGNPDVTVVIPTRDGAAFVARAIDSALRQEDVLLEVVIVDDASTDETPAVLSNVGDERVRTVRHDAAAGQARSRNAGIEAARGAWVAFLDHDDLWAPGKLHTQLRALAAKHALWSYTGVVVLDERLTAIGERRPPRAETLLEDLLADNVVPAGPSSVVAQTTLLRSAGGFDERLEYMTDWDLWIRLAQKGLPAPCPDALAGYVVHPASLHVRDVDGALPELDYLAGKHGDLARAHGRRFGAVAAARWKGASHRGAGRRLEAAKAYARSAVTDRRPDMLARALGAALGERAMSGGRRLARRPATPDWVLSYR